MVNGHLRPCLKFAARTGRQLGERRSVALGHAVHVAVDHGLEQRFLGLEMVEQTPLADPGALGHGVEGEVGRAVGAHNGFRSVEDMLAAARAARRGGKGRAWTLFLGLQPPAGRFIPEGGHHLRGGQVTGGLHRLQIYRPAGTVNKGDFSVFP